MTWDSASVRQAGHRRPPPSHPRTMHAARRTAALQSLRRLWASRAQQARLVGHKDACFPTLQPTATQHLLDAVWEVEGLAGLWATLPVTVTSHPPPPRMHIALRHVRALSEALELALPQLMDMLDAMPGGATDGLGYRQAAEHALVGVARHLHAFLHTLQRHFLVPPSPLRAAPLHQAWQGWCDVQGAWALQRLRHAASKVAWYAEQLDQCTCVWRQQCQVNGMLVIPMSPLPLLQLQLHGRGGTG
jgi:hypothetical protein